MPKRKYKFNPDSLNYDRLDLTFKEKFVKFITNLGALLVVSIIFYILYSSFFDTPKEKGLKRENNFLKSQYDVLNQQLHLIENTLEDLKNRDSNIYRIIFEAEPIPYTIRMAGYGGAEMYKNLDGYKNTRLVKDITYTIDQLTRRVYIQSKSYDEIIKLATNKEKLLSSIPAIMPIANKDLKRTASGWGYRIHPIYKIRKFHYGIDFAAPTGTEIYATGDGVISKIKKSMRGYGNWIIIDHGFGYKTLYAHMSKFNTREGQRVKRGDVIGFVGNSGTSTAPHLHYGVEKNNRKINPINYFFEDLSPKEYEKMIVISTNNGQTFD